MEDQIHNWQAMCPHVFLPLSVLQVKPSERSHACHYLYLKEHSSTHQTVEWPQGRTLEVHNIPPYSTQVRFLFQYKFVDCAVDDAMLQILNDQIFNKMIHKDDVLHTVTVLLCTFFLMTFAIANEKRNDSMNKLFDPWWLGFWTGAKHEKHHLDKYKSSWHRSSYRSVPPSDSVTDFASNRITRFFLTIHFISNLVMITCDSFICLWDFILFQGC